MLKKAISFVLIASMMFAIGCSTCNNCSDDYYTDDAKAMKSSGFNQETYIWESLFFPTNRTSGVQ